MSNPSSNVAAAQPFTDTERLDFLERQSVKFQTKTAADPDYTVYLFGAQGLLVFTGATARDAIDSAMHDTNPY
jgi:hypothetical protein